METQIIFLLLRIITGRFTEILNVTQLNYIGDDIICGFRFVESPYSAVNVV